MPSGTAVGGHFTMLNQQGISLLELLISVMISSILVLSVLTLLPYLQNQLLLAYHDYYLKQNMMHYLLSIEKDLRRTGFVSALDVPETHPVLQITPSPPCVIVIYDLERNGRYDLSNSKKTSIFGYRLKDKTLEYARGTPNCTSSNWEKISDPAEILVTDFQVKAWPNYYQLSVSAYRKKQPDVHPQMTRFVRRENR